MSDTKKLLKNNINIVISVITMLLFCASMTLAARSSDMFDRVFDLWVLLCIVYGAAATAVDRKHIDKTVLVFTVLFFVTRFISYRLNGISVTYGGTIMIQLFYLVGVCRRVFGGKPQIRASLYAFQAFDFCAILMCYYNYCFRREYAEKLYEELYTKGITPQTTVFQNPNYAGMMAGAAIIIGCALIVNDRFRKQTVLLMTPVIILSAYMLFVHTGCRSSQTGIIVIAVMTAVLAAFKRTDSVRRVVGGFLIFCFMTLIPLYMLVYWGDHEEYLSDVSPLEMQLEAVSSDRYSLWKTTVLSMEGHELFGYGNVSTAWDKRKELVYNNPMERTAEVYIRSADHKRQHNGYLALLNEAGITGTVSIMLLLLSRVRKLKGRFRDGQWEKLLLPFLFWINLFEAKFIIHVFFTGLLMMILLLPPDEEEIEQ